MGWSCSGGKGEGDVERNAASAKTESAAPAAVVPPDTHYSDGQVYRNNGKDRTTINLGDGTKVLLSAGSMLRVDKDFNKTERGLTIDGEAFFDVKADAAKPFTIHTRNLQVSVLGTRFRIDAYAANAGEEVDLLSGRLKVIKSYHSSTDNEPEVLDTGEMVMINRDIDLMEKEKLSPAELEKLKGSF